MTGVEHYLASFFGYAADVFIIAAYLMKNIKLLRIIVAIGCLCFVIYGCIIGSIPVAIANGIACFINVYYLYKIYKDEFAKKKEVIAKSN
ncbi:MAG: YgjV family protein [Psittacicella sp.]